MNLKFWLLLILLIWNYRFSNAGTDPFIVHHFVRGSFAIADKSQITPIFVDEGDYTGVIKAAKDLQEDLKKVTGLSPVFKTEITSAASRLIIIGTLGQSQIINQLVATKKIDVADIAGKWESTMFQVIANPFPGIDSAFIIAGSDKRGTIYGVYEISKQIGVSPWYYWADVPVEKHERIFVKSGRHIIASPAVKYRGIFLNDEAPALSGWTHEKHGGFNQHLYKKVFELILRLKGNYLWPAMWGNTFNFDDTLNPVLADEFGIVMGTSHHEPMLRAQQEWKLFGKGPWNYEQNSLVLKDFWQKGIVNMGTHESIVTIGMRGDGDEPMSEESNIQLLEKIVKDQREIIEQVTGKKADETPQLWALYKEVQEYYDKGMRVPDDVTLLLCDDNWGNLRRLPQLNEPKRKGGYGIYYHFDYVGGPRNYKWLNTNPIQKIWEQMNLAYAYDANKIWIVNVGDLKPMEFPIQFFLDFAWSPSAIPAEKLSEYTTKWCIAQFGEEYAVEIGDLLNHYLKFNGRRKPELLNSDTYSLRNYNEFDKIVHEFNALVKRSEYIYSKLSKEKKDAFYQLILHPVSASANLNELYYNVALNRMYAKQGRNTANEYINKVRTLYQKDSLITDYYNNKLAGGKWNHMMDQTHIGYTYWQQPEKNSMPETSKINVPQKSVMGMAIEGSDSSWFSKEKVNIAFPKFNSFTNASHYFEIFNKGTETFTYKIKAPDYLIFSNTKGPIKNEERIYVNVNWEKAPAGKSSARIIITGSEGSRIEFPVSLNNNNSQTKGIKAFGQTDNYVSMEASQYSRANNSRPIQWLHIPDYGKTLGGMTTSPVTNASVNPNGNNPHLEYDIYVIDTGNVNISTFISPTIDFTNSDGLKFALSIDGELPEIVNISKDYYTNTAWEQSVADNIKILTISKKISKPGQHVIKYWMVDSGVVLQKIVLHYGDLRPSYLGPPNTYVFK